MFLIKQKRDKEENKLKTANGRGIFMRKIIDRKLTIVALICIILVLGAGVYFWVNSKDSTNNRKEMVCTQTEINQAYDALVENQTKKLTEIHDNIVSKERFINDINCLNILVSYYAKTTQITKAREFYTLLEKQYSEGQRFKEPLGTGVTSIETIRSSMDFLDKIEKQSENGNGLL